MTSIIPKYLSDPYSPRHERKNQQEKNLLTKKVENIVQTSFKSPLSPSLDSLPETKEVEFKEIKNKILINMSLREGCIYFKEICEQIAPLWKNTFVEVDAIYKSFGNAYGLDKNEHYLNTLKDFEKVTFPGTTYSWKALIYKIDSMQVLNPLTVNFLKEKNPQKAAKIRKEFKNAFSDVLKNLQRLIQLEKLVNDYVIISEKLYLFHEDKYTTSTLTKNEKNILSDIYNFSEMKIMSYDKKKAFAHMTEENLQAMTPYEVDWMGF